MFAHRALLKQDRALGIDPAGDQGGGHFADVGAKLRRIDIDRQRVKIGEEEQALCLVLHPNPAQDCAEEVAEVQVTGRLNSGNDAHQSVTFLRRSRIMIASRSIPPIAHATAK